MASSTENYIALQNIYKNLASQDREKFLALLSEKQNFRPDPFSSSIIDNFLKNLRNLGFLKNSSCLEEEFSCGNLSSEDTSSNELEAQQLLSSLVEKIQENSSDPDLISMQYLILRYLGFGWSVNSREAELQPQKSTDKFQELKDKVKNSVFNDLLVEYSRVGNLEFHPVASIIGNLAAQECIKLITRQYLPISGHLMYDGIHNQFTDFVAF